MRVTIAVLAMLLAIACKQEEQDACQRAFARIARIQAARHQHSMRAEFEAEALDACRHGKYAQYDPVLRCAMDAKDDATAADCIDRFVKAVMPPPAGSDKRDPSKRQGWNPMLAPSPP